MSVQNAKNDIIKFHRDVAGGMRHIIDNLDKDADRTEQTRVSNNAWRIAQKERLETLKEVYQVLASPVKVFEDEKRASERAERLAELREDPDVQTYLLIAADDRVQEYIRLAKESL